MTEQTGLARVEQQSSGAIGVFSSQVNFEAAQRMAKALSSSALMPEAYRNNIPNCLIAMELASRIGASVMMVAQNLDVIHGRPSWRASFLIACVNNSRRFTPLRFRFQGQEGTQTWGCRAVAKDRESGEECVGALITLKMAADEGWSKKNGSKWLTMSEQMLQYRAAAFWTRVFAPELSLGMHTSDEVQDSYAVGSVVPATALPVNLVPGTAESLASVLGIAESTVVDESVADEPADPTPENLATDAVHGTTTTSTGEPGQLFDATSTTGKKK